MTYEVVLYIAAFTFGFFFTIPAFAYSGLKYYLSFLLFLIPYVVLGFLSLPNLFPEIETLKIVYVSWIMGTFLSWGIKESKAKKSNNINN